ncbi:FAD-dependent oxidoreductase [Candidatus Laterigemmans baculatus]|uniref:FAD-dependent oxidoreductase n=1 Tax=Candidatus Laterigemmans baculatus TaxID=2770505 RepID=UPI0013DBA341|nr:FAD-dependent oxidoreductase [Candidatus Laterigemmans baculatus]
MFPKLILSLTLFLACSPLVRAEEPTFDIVIYGGTSSGVTAAVQADRMGKTVVLIEPTQFVGGLTTGGLGATDIGNKRAIGGLSREFYQRVFQYYTDPAVWDHEARDEYFAREIRGNSSNSDSMWTFEPHVASKIYQDMLDETDVVVVLGERLDLEQGVVKDGTRIVKIVMESGREFPGRMFIDATYEGDLMAKAGVTYHVGRESNSEYGETLNGVQTGRAIYHQFTKNVDPYIVPGDPSSGVLPGINTEGPGEEFSGDKKVQAYNFRMCTTDVPEIRREWPKPDNYDPQWYELLLRNFEAGDERIPWAPKWMPNRKTDTNNNFAISTDFIGQNWDYPEADYATREKIWQAHEDWQKGLMWTLANSPRVPEKVREHFHRLGLAKDEFLDNDNWPRQLYIRESRRMVSDYVMTEQNCLRQEIVEDSVGMGAYNMDSHHVQRYITPEGFVRNEGDVQVRSRPYPVSYRSIRPKADQCSNLLVPVCLSASHISYGSIRMEPVFMVMGQSAATAAAHAIDEGVAVQEISYEKLKQRLLEDNQVLDFESPPIPERVVLSKAQLGGIVVDDMEAELEGFDSMGTTVSPFVQAGYRHDRDTGKGEQKARFQPRIPRAGKYRVSIAYTANPNRATNVPVRVHHADGTTEITVNQRKAAPEKDLLLPIGEFTFAAGSEGFVEISNQGTNGHVIIDAVQWLPVE